MNTGIARTIVSSLLIFVLAASCIVSRAQTQTLYVSNYDTGDILKVAPDGTVTTFATGIGSAGQIAFDNSQNLYVGTGDGGGGIVAKVAPDGTVSTFLHLSTPTGVAIDNGVIYLSSPVNLAVYKVTSNGMLSLVAGGLDATPQYVAFDKAGNVYTSNNYAGTIDKITPTGVSTLVGGLDRPEQLAYDGSNNDIYVAERFNGSIAKIAPDGTLTTFVSGLPGQPDALALSASGDFYVSLSFAGPNNNETVIDKISPSGQVTQFGDSSLLSGADGGANGFAFWPSTNVATTPESGIPALLIGLIGAGWRQRRRRTRRG